MNKSTRLLITSAAIAGLYAGALSVRTYAADAGTPAPKDEKAKKASCGAHGRAGKNGCAGKGGCKTSDKGCAGKNSCEGKGGCAVKEKAKSDKPADKPKS